MNQKILKKENTKSQIICPVILLVVSLLWSGGYYEYSSAILGAVAAVMLWVGIRKNRKELSCENYLLFAACLAFFYFLSCLYATDSGMAFTGAVKKSVILLFAFVISTLTVEQRRQILHKLPEMAVLTVIVGAVGSIVPFFRSYVIAAGRFCGTFGYANTYALFLMLALLVLLETYTERNGWKKFSIGGILLIALWFTGSRYTWLLAGFILVIYALRQKRSRKIALCALALLGAATLAAATVFRDSEAMGRLFSTNLSTFYGRILYWQDAWKLVVKHFFGMGYLGYFYEQTGIQTGVYTVRYVHNDLLQWILDIGWIPVIFLLVILGFALYNKKRPFGQKILLLTLLLHSCMEFDFEHTVVAFLWILILSCTEEKMISMGKRKKQNGELPQWVGKAAAVILGCIGFYMAVPLSMYAMGKMEKAVFWYPAYTDASLALLSVQENPEEAEKIADRILKQNDTASLAYDAKAQVAFQNGEFEDMMFYKKQAIERNKYDANEYMDYLTMLNEVLLYSQEQSDGEWQAKIIKEMEQLLTQIEKNEATVSNLGKKIDDRVEIALPEDIVEQIKNLR